MKALLLAFSFLAAVPAAIATPPEASTPADPAYGVPVPASQLQLDPATPAADRLFSVKVRDLATGASFEVGFDPASERAARASIPVLASFYRQLSDALALDPSEQRWSDVLFARDADTLVLTRETGRTVWKIDVGADGELSDKGARMLYQTLPHEQVHATQPDAPPGQGMPRWFEEGQAEWAGVQVTAAWNAGFAAEDRAELAAAIAKTGPSVALSRWGGVQPRPEAILRQLTPEQRVQFLKDPSSVPGPFSFGPDDLISDESNTKARYAASLALFERLEAEAGRPALQAWFQAVRQSPRQDGARLVELARTATAIDISADLH